MDSNRLKLNTNKTQIIWLGTRQQLAKINVKSFVLGPSTVHAVDCVVDLGVHIDSNLTMCKHVANLCKSCFFQLRQLRSIRRSLTVEAATALVHAFISSRLDYCNSLLFGVSDSLLRKLQRVQNAAARLITCARKFEHVTPFLRDNLHWHPISQRIHYKLAMLVYKCLNGVAPQYLTELCVPVSSLPGRRQLRSASNLDLFVPRMLSKNMGPRAFAACGPSLWNSLPSVLRLNCQSVSDFSRKLKNYLFQCAYT